MRKKMKYMRKEDFIFLCNEEKDEIYEKRKDAPIACAVTKLILYSCSCGVDICLLVHSR